MADPPANGGAAIVRRRPRWPARRIWAVALVACRQGLRMRLWILAAAAVAILVMADVYSPRFDPVFEGIPAAVSTSLLVMAVLVSVVAVFFATHSLPAEIETRVAHTLVTKPVSRTEIVVGKVVGQGLLLAILLVIVGAGAYGYIHIRSREIRSLAGRRLEESRPRAIHPADLNALEAVARNGPLGTFRYRQCDAGPDVQIHHLADGPPDPAMRWILGQTGMVLNWDLTDTPIAEWVSNGRGTVRLRLHVVRAPESPDAPAEVQVSVPAGHRPLEVGGPEATARPVYEVLTNVPASGEVEVAVASATAVPDPAGRVINLPDEAPVCLRIMAMKPGQLVGAGEGSLEVIGPGGQSIRVPAAPEVHPAYERRRVMLAGRPGLPREAAVFRFDAVPASVLPEADVPVEIGFAVDAYSPALVQPEAEATFVNPTTGQQQSFRFTPEANHPAILYIDRQFWHGGPLEVRLECLTEDDFLGLLPGSVRLRLDGGPFVVHFATGVLRVWLYGTVLASAGVLLSTRLTWFVSILGTIAFFILGMTRDFILHSTPLGYLAWRTARWADSHAPWYGWLEFWQRVFVPLPDLQAMLPPDSLYMGQAMSLGELGASLGWAGLGVAILLAAGAVAFRRREVAA